MKLERPRARAGRIPPRAPDRETGSCGYASSREGDRAYARAHGGDHLDGRDDGDRGCGPPHVSAAAHPRALDHVCGRAHRSRARAHDVRYPDYAQDCFCVRVCVRPPFGFSRFLGLVLRQASSETPVPSRHEHSAVNFTRKLRSLLVK